MLSNTYLADSAGICPADLDLLDRLRRIQERLDRLLEPAVEAPASAVSAVGSGTGPDLRRAPRTSIWKVTAAWHRPAIW
jgi:hypothetical protein